MMLLRLLHRSVRRQFRSLGFESKTLRATASTIHYLVREHSHPKGTIVLVHGLGTSSSTWVRILPHLKVSYRIVALDLPGFGFSTVTSVREFCTLNEHVEALSELIAAVTETPIILAGQSLGGWLCCRYAAQAPERVKHLVLIDTAGVSYPGVEHLRGLFSLTSVSDTQRLLNALWYHYPWYFKPFAGSIYRELGARRMNELVASIEADDFLGEELSHLAMPVSIIWGKQDGVTSPKSVEVLQKFMPHSTVHFIDQCGHVPQLERPEILAGILNKVLET
jgi:pimeloyl-ACP methyl ester carboxylesterase